ncbi:hypothetical protein CLOM_g8723 [Closterium sp. NIES-68]|nr:hypothetical protein CLOM_g8723 [Closterium sp. NIES-68]GJP68607.1 hypothetical protein CLOP_g25287 [Closterium sp. NIES-67]
MATSATCNIQLGALGAQSVRREISRHSISQRSLRFDGRLDGRLCSAFLSGNQSERSTISGSCSSIFQGTNLRLPRNKLVTRTPGNFSSRLSVRASAVSRNGDTREVWEVPPSWRDFPIVRTIAGVAVLFAIERALAATARAYSFPVPAPVLMLAGIGALMATGTKAAEMVYDWSYPAISFFDQWMPLFFVPSVASIALAPLPTGIALTKSIALLLSSYLLTLFLSALLARSIGYLLDSWGSFVTSLAERGRKGAGRGGRRKRGPLGDGSMSDGEKVERLGDAARMWGKQAAQVGAKALAKAAMGAGEKDVQQLAVKAAKALDKVADSIKTPARQKLPPLPLSSAKYLYLAAAVMLSPALLTPVPTAPMVAPGLLLLSIAVFQSAKTLPANIRSLLVPTVAAGGIMTAMMAMYGSYALNNWQAGIRLYSQGAGAFLVALIGPAVGALGFKVHTEKPLLKRYALDIAATCAIMAPVQFVVTALLGRLLMAPKLVVNSLIPSHTTLGLAIEMVPLLSASTGLVVAGVTIAGTTGISTARTLLDQWKVRDAIHRGLAVGIASHSLGTSALVAEEPRSAAVSGLAFALKGTLSVILISIPAFRVALLQLAGTA